MSKKILNLKYHVLQKGVEYQTSGYKEPDRPDHAALDIISKAGGGASDKIVTPFPGKVLELRNTVQGNSTTNASGNYVIIDFGNGFSSRSYHMKLQSIVVSVGQQLAAGDVIGTMGYTGNTIPKGPGGTHLHFEIRKNGAKIDPMPYLMGKKLSVPHPVTAPPAETTKSVTEVAREIINGTKGWGNGTERINKLRAHGYDPTVVQAEVNRLISERTKPITPPPPAKSIAEVAREIINGTKGWGNGTERINNLTAKGYDPKTVQNEVNRILREGTKPTTPPVVATVKVGSIVMLKPGCTDYTGRTLRAFLFARKYRVSELKKDRAVITYGGSVIAAVKVGNLILQS